MSERKTRRSPRPEDRQRDAERTRRAILDAAAAEFSAKGFAGARVAAIAARAGVNQQLISYYFDGKRGLYLALSERWRGRESDLIGADMSLPEQMRRYALEARHNPEGVRLLAWNGLEYTGPDSDPDHTHRAERLRGSVEQIRALQAAGDLPAELDPACLTVMLMAAGMATTTLPHVIEGVCGVDPRSGEFIERYADQVAALVMVLARAGHDGQAS